MLQNWQHLFCVGKQIQAICIMLLVLGKKNDTSWRMFVLQGPNFFTDTRFIIDKNEFYKLSPFLTICQTVILFNFIGALD
jgi:hypothetical protein